MLRVVFVGLFFSIASFAGMKVNDYACEQARSRSGQTCEFMKCTGPSGVAIATRVGGEERWILTEVRSDGKKSYIPALELITREKGVFKTQGAIQRSFPEAIFPKDLRDDFITYDYLTSPSYLDSRQLALSSCEDRELKVLVDKIDARTSEVREELKTRDYVKVVEMVETTGLTIRMLPRDEVEKKYCNLGSNTFASDDAKKALEEAAFQPPVGKVLSQNEAQKLFDEIKNLKDLPWGYSLDGCYARAQIAAEYLEKKGVAAGKAWFAGTNLWPKNMKRSPGVSWGYHVVPFVYVKGADGKVRRMAMDPATQDKPVEAYEFARNLSPDKNPKVVTTRWTTLAMPRSVPVVQMIFTNTDFYDPGSLYATGRETNRISAETTNRLYIKELQQLYQR